MKNLYTKLSILLLIIFSSFASFSQVLITDDGTTNPDNSAMLEIKSNSKGMLIPRLTTGQRTNITSPVAGLLVYDTTAGSFFIYGKNSKGTNAWINLSSGAGVWETDALNNVYLADTYNNVGIGTSNPTKKLVIKADNDNDTLMEVLDKDGKPLMILTPKLTKFYFNETAKGVAGGFAVGRYATAKGGKANLSPDTSLFVVTPDSTRVYTTGSAVTAVAGGFAVGRYATAKGNKALKAIKYFETNANRTRVYTDGESTKGIAGGFAVGRYATAKGENAYKYFYADIDSTRIYTNGGSGKGVAGGFAVGRYATAKAGGTGNYMYMKPENYFIGDSSGLAIQLDQSNKGKYNTFFGYQTGMNNTVAGNNVFIGYKSGISNVGTVSGLDTLGSRNVFLGYEAGYNNTNGTNNVLLGYQAGHANVTTGENVFIGTSVANKHTTGNKNVIIGNEASSENRNSLENVIIGNDAGVGKIGNTIEAKYNVILGASSGKNLNGADDNVFIGHNAGFGDAAGITGTSNVIIGEGSGNKIKGGSQNIFLGKVAGESVTDANDNVFLGTEAGRYQTTGGANTYIGNFAGKGQDNSHPNTGGENIFIGNSTGQSNTNGSWNVFIGTESGSQNQTGGSNVFIGQKTGNSMDASDYNTIIGCSAGENAQSGIRNVFLGYKAGLRHFAGNDNIFIGDSAGANITGNNKISHRNVFLGNFAGSNVSEANDNVFIGNKAGEGVVTGITGDFNIAIGESAGNSISSGEKNVFLGNEAGFSNQSGSYNTFIGYKTGHNSTGNANSMLGNQAGYNNTSGSGNTFMGDNTGFQNQTGANNSFFGAYSGQWNNSGANNTAMGYHAAERSGGDYNVNIGSYAGYRIDGDRNIFIGGSSGYKSGYTSQEGNIFIGYYAGHTETGNNKLVIENDGNANYNPLIYGEFDNDYVRIGGTLNVNGNYNLPTSDGTSGYVLTTNGSGVTSWTSKNASADATTASNGLTKSSDDIQLGGSLIKNTNIFQGNYSMLYYLTGSGDFMIHDGSKYSFYVQDDAGGGNVGIGTSSPSEQLTVYKAGDVTTKIQTDDGNSANIELYELTSGSDYGFKFEYDGSDDKLHLWSKGFSGNDARRVTFLKDGKVGIGTTSPTELLQINGNVYASGGDVYTSSGNGVINCAGGIMNANVNVIADNITNMGYAGADEDLYIQGKLEVDGSVYKTGTSTWSVQSDKRLKKDIREYKDGLTQILQINPVYFKYNEKAGVSDETKEYVGIIAQDIKDIAPYTVELTPFKKEEIEDETGKVVNIKWDGTEYYTFNPSALTYMLINGMKEQQKEIDNLKKQNSEIQELKKQIQELKELIKNK